MRGVLLVSGLLAFCAGFASTAALAAKDPPPNPVQALANAPSDAWRDIDPENLLIIDLPAGPISIEMRPDLAPQTVAQIKTLVRRGFYNGLNFHRVIEGFVAQGGDPKGDGTGGSDLPNIPAEFTRDTKEIPNFTVIGRDRQAARVGFIDGVAAAAQPEALRSAVTSRRVDIWGAHCQGAMSMARATDVNSGNSQFFLVIGDARTSLDSRYTVWGWIVDGVNSARRIERGEPPKRPTPIIRMQIAADIPVAERPDIKVMKTDSPAFLEYIKDAGLVDDTGFVKDLCDIKAPRKIKGTIAL